MKKNVFSKQSKSVCAGLLVALALVAAKQAGAQNLAPPVDPSLQILDLAGTPIYSSHTYTTAPFLATTTSTEVTFVFRHDPGFFTFDDPSVENITTSSPGPAFVNANFDDGATVPPEGATGWTYFEQAGVTFLGYELASPGGWFDGATQGYDGIDQSIPTIPGDTYDITFDLSQIGNNVADYQEISDNGEPGTGGNGIDMLAYAGVGLPPTTVPDGSSTFVLLLGCLSLLAYRKQAVS
ncbi:MAG: hypothetical protein ABSA47_01395 [Verrucomicrobiota bacterium]|jgi:hypothetical protein